LTRGSKALTLPGGVRTAAVDYDDVESLAKAFEGQDAVVSVIPGHLAELQYKPIEAAIKTGVSRFIPSEYGADIRNPLARKMPFMKTKSAVEKAVEDAAAAAGGKFTYTNIMGGAFVEWVFSYEPLIPVKQRKCHLQNGGNIPFTMTRMNDYGKAVVGVLANPEKTKNRVIYIEGYRATQLQLLKLAQEVVPGEWQIEVVDMDKNAAIAEEKMLAGQWDIPNVDAMVFKLMFAQGYGGQIDSNENSLVGVTRTTDEEIQDIIVSLA
jgi:uncharacterized protein YbjT (DUF2867 family)